MLQPISLFASFTPPTLLAFLSYVSSPSVHAQIFQPLPSINPCNAFVGGQGLYIIGGVAKDLTTVRQIFMLDLSVSWSTNAPVFKQLPFGPKGEGVCTMINNGEDLFVLEDGGGYLYNVRSEKWQVLSGTNFTNVVVGVAATDPESGLIYIAGSSADFAEQLIEIIDPRTMTANTAETNAESYSVAAWSTPLKRMLLFSTGSSNPGTFTPSETNKPTKGWGDLPNNGPTLRWSCIAPIDGGSKMALYGNDVVSNIGTIYVFDVAKRTWTKGASTIELDGCVCAVTGDQVVLWGGESKGKATNATLVYNMKTNKWTSNYIAPPRSNTTTTTSTSQPSQTSTQENPYTTNPTTHLPAVRALSSL